MTLTVPPIDGGQIDHDAGETLVGTLAPTGGVAPYEVVAAGLPGGIDLAAADGIEAGAASTGAPAATQLHRVAAGGVSAGAATLGIAVPSQRHRTAAAGLEAGAAALGAPSIEQRHAVSAAGVSAGAATAGAAVLAQLHRLAAGGLAAGAAETGAPSAIQIHRLSGAGIVAGEAELGRPALGADLSTLERVLRALAAALLDSAPDGAEVIRNSVEPLRPPPAGVLILRDGDPGRPERDLDGVWHHRHRARVDAVVTETAEAERDARLDVLRAAIGAALADRSLGGLCDWSEVEAARTETLPVEGGAAVKGVSIPVSLLYAASGPLT